MKRLFGNTLLVCCLALLLPASAGAVTLINPDGSVAQPYQGFADQSRVPVANVTVLVRPANGLCGSSQACTSAAPPTIWLSDVSQPMEMLSLMHELGHQYDFVMPEWKRVVVRRIVGLELPWSIDRPHTALSYSEVFAVIYAECAVLKRPESIALTDDSHSTEISTRRMARLCRLIRQPN